MALKVKFRTQFPANVSVTAPLTMTKTGLSYVFGFNPTGIVLSGALINGATISSSTITVADNVFTLQDDGDATKQAKFQNSLITTGTLRTYSLPDANGTLVLSTNSQTIQNKSLDNTNTVTLADTLFTLQDDGDVTKQAKFQLSGITTATIRTYTLPDANDTLATLSSNQTFQNKTYDTASNTLKVNGNTLTATAGTGTITFPTGTYAAVGDTVTQVLTNKTIAGASNTLSVRIANDVTGLGTNVATFLATPSSANLLAALTVKTGTGNAVFNTSPQMVTPDIIGTVAVGNASAGSVGEYVSSIIASGSAVALTTATAANMTSISLTAGDWDVWYIPNFIPGATTNITQLLASISTTTATANTAGDSVSFTTYASAGIVPTVNCGAPMIQKRINVSATTTIFAVAQCAFTVSTLGAWGSLQARRVR